MTSSMATSSITLNQSNFTFPAVAELDFAKNCSLVGQWQRIFYDAELGVSHTVTAAYYRQALGDVDEDATNGQILDWYDATRNGFVNETASRNHPFTQYVLQAPRQKCLPDVCAQLEWDGYRDFLSRGMLIAVFIQATLITIFTIPLLVEKIFGIEFKMSLAGWFLGSCERLRTIFRVLVDTATIFAFVLSVQCLKLLVPESMYKVSLHPAETAVALDLAIPNMLGAIALAAVSRKEMTIYLTIVPYALVVGYSFWNLFRIAKPTEPLDYYSPFEVFCLSSPSSSSSSSEYLRQLGNTHCIELLAAGTVFLGAPFMHKFLTTTFKYRRGTKSYPMLALAMTQVGYFTGCVVGMWYLLVDFSETRRAILARNGGGSSRWTGWGFGDTFAVTLWCAVMFEAMLVMLYGVRWSVGTRLPLRYEVIEHVDSGKDEGEVEKELRLPWSKNCQDVVVSGLEARETTMPSLARGRSTERRDDDETQTSRRKSTMNIISAIRRKPVGGQGQGPQVMRPGATQAGYMTLAGYQALALEPQPDTSQWGATARRVVEEERNMI